MDTTTVRPSNTRYAVGCDLGASNTRVALVQSDGQIVALRSEVTASGAIHNAQAMLRQVVRLYQEMIAEPKARVVSLDGIGVGVAGQVNRQGEIVGTNGPREWHWQTVPFKALLQRELGEHLPIHVENDSKAAVWGEYLYGAGRGTRHLLGLTVGTGVGGGIVLDGKLFHGSSGLAGHLGLISMDMHGETCPSGVVACLERYASGTGIAHYARQELGRGRRSRIMDLMDGDIDKVTCEMVFEAGRFGDTLALEVIAQAAYALGIGICSLLHILNPDRVVIGGGVAEQGDTFLDPVRRTVRESSLPQLAHTPVVGAELGNLAGVVGAASLCW